MKPEFSPSGGGLFSSHLQMNSDRILELVEGTLADRERAALETHLQSCPECADFFREAQQLELELQDSINAPAVSANFVERLEARIDSENSRNAARMGVPIEVQVDECVARLRRQLFRPSSLLDLLSYALAFGIGGYLLAILSSMVQAEAEAVWKNVALYHGLIDTVLVAFVVMAATLFLVARGSITRWTENA